jgi:pimeloyl-ACP methyl ester carboxylesterase
MVNTMSNPTRSDACTLPINGTDVEVLTTDRGQGRIVLMLHGGAGPQSVTAFADLLATERPVRVITPTHPGFGGTGRPAEFSTIHDLAVLYVGLLEAMDLHDVIVVGNSIGGWIAAEMALLPSNRIASVVLVDAVGIEVPGHPVADFFSLTLTEVAELSYHDPSGFRLPPASEAQMAIMAGNRAALAVYGGAPSMSDPTLAERLIAVTVPTLVLWGESDRIVDPDYGRAFAAAIPGAQFESMPGTGHVPQVETPHLLAGYLRDLVEHHAVDAAVRG